MAPLGRGTGDLRVWHFSTLRDLERQTKIHLDNGTVAATKWFADNREQILALPSENNPDEQIEALLRFVQWYFKDGQYAEAVVFALRAVQIAQDAGLSALLRRSLNLLGLAYSRVGNYAEATICYVNGLDVAERIGDRIGKAAILANLAELRFNNGLIGESIALNTYVLEIAADEPQFIQLIADAHHNIAAAALLVGDIDTATDEIEKATRASIDPTNQFLVHQQIIVQCTRSRICIENGQLDEAQHCARHAERWAAQMNSRPAMAQASLACALCDAALGNVGLAMERLDSVREQVSFYEPLYRDLLEAEAACNRYAGKRRDAARLQRKYLSYLAQYQRHSVIRQIAALQLNVRSLCPVPEDELLVLPQEARKRLLETRERPRKDCCLHEYVEALASIADQRDLEGGEHGLRVGRLVELLAQRVGYDKSKSQMLGHAARLHDIGKLATPDVLLLKRGKLTPTELAIVRRHTIEGSQLLSDLIGTIEGRTQLSIDAGSLRAAAEIALHHHEWWNGSGYPRRLEKSAIPESGRLTAIADVFDELTSRRPYHVPLSVGAAIDQMVRLSGTQFDPTLFSEFVELLTDLQREYGADLERFSPRDAELSTYQKASRVIAGIIDSIGNSTTQTLYEAMPT